jgi:hypothetical protein
MIVFRSLLILGLSASVVVANGKRAVSPYQQSEYPDETADERSRKLTVFKGTKSAKSSEANNVSAAHGSKGSKGSKSQTSYYEGSGKGVSGRVGGNRRGKSGGTAATCDCCSTFTFDFVGEVIPPQLIVGTANTLGALYKLDDNVYVPDQGELQVPLSDPAVQVNAKCTQIRLGKECIEGPPPVCCEGLTLCDYVFKLSDLDGAVIGEFTASGNLVDNTINSIPITGGNGPFKGAKGEVIVKAEYDNPAIDSCPNIGEATYYIYDARPEFDVCDWDL